MPSPSTLWLLRGIFACFVVPIRGYSSSSRVSSALRSTSSSGCNRRHWLGDLATAGVSTLLWTASEGAGALESDEYTLTIEEGTLGLELEEIRRYQNVGSRVQVKRLIPGGQAENAGTVSPGDVLVSVNGASLEEGGAKRAYQLITESSRPVKLTLRRPSAFTDILQGNGSPSEIGVGSGTTITTEVAPASAGGDSGKQVVRVSRERVPAECVVGAQQGDLLEISYVGKLAVDGTIFDGSAVTVNGQGIAGRGGDTTVFFVLGNQPAGQFPPSWDVSLGGMCVGERRIIEVPPVLGYGAKGLPRRRIPPNAALLYEVDLVSINGDAQPGRKDTGGWKGVPGEGW